MEQVEDPAGLRGAERNMPRLRAGVEIRPLSAGRAWVTHPQAASQILDAGVAEALRLCQGQPVSEALPEVRRVIDYDCTEQEWLGFLQQISDSGFFEGHPKRHPRMRLFDPQPVLEFLTKNFPWLFSTAAVVILFALLLAGLGQLLAHREMFFAEVARLTASHPVLSVVFFYFCFVPVGLLHELAHGIVCRRMGGEVLEVGVRKDTANLYVLSNNAALRTPRALILYYAGGPFFDMVAIFLLVNLWLMWPNPVTLLLLLPQALFFLQYSYAMENGSDLSRIVKAWTGIEEAAGRRAFLKSFFAARPKTPAEWRRAAVYLGSISLQVIAAAWLIWSFRQPVDVSLWPGMELRSVPFWPVILYAIYRMLRLAMSNWDRLRAALALRPPIPPVRDA